MPSKPNMIASLRGKHDPHYKLAGRVDRLEKEIPIQLSQLHKTLSKSFGMQRKTLMRVLGLEGRVAELEAAKAAVQEAVEDVAEVVEDVAEELGVEDEIPEGLDDLLDDVRGEKEEAVGGTTTPKKPAATKKKPKKKRPATPVGKKIPQKKKPKIRAKKKKIKAKDLGYSSRVFGKDQSGNYLSPEERKRRFKLGDTQPAGQLSTSVTPEDEAGAGAGKGTVGLLAPLQAINASLDNINKTFIEGAKDDKKAADDARKADEKKKRKGAEGALEKIGGVAVKGVQAVLKPAMGIFQRIWDFLKTVLLGRIVMNVFDYFAKNQDKLTSLFKFVKDWWPVMVAGILAIFAPILGPAGWVIGIGALIWWSVNRITALVKAVGNLFGNIWKFITGGNKDADKAEAAALKDIDKETKGMEEPDLSKGESPPSGDTAKLDKGQKAIDESQKLKGPKESGDEPVKMNKGGQVPGQGDTDTVPAMLTPGEFVMSKGAVQQYGVDTLEGMNAAAGGTNKPTTQKGSSVGTTTMVPHFKGGGKAAGVVTDPKERQEQEAYMLKYVNEERALQGLEPLTNLTYAPGVELTKMIGPGPRTKETSNTNMDFDKGIKTTSKTRTVDGKTSFSATIGQTTDEDKQKFFAANPHAQVLLDIKNQAALDNLGSDISASVKMNGGGLVPGYAGGGLIGRIKGSVKNVSGRVRKALNPPVRHRHPVTVSYDNEVLKSQKPAPGGQPPRQDLPSFDAGAMVSMSKIKTLGISV